MSHDHHHHAPQVVVPEIPNKPSWFWRAATGPAGRRNVMLLACSTFSLWLMSKMTIGALDNQEAKNGSRYWQHSQDLFAGKDPYALYRKRAHDAHSK
eukprot:TRINITY_DN2479_c0_g1_i1.p1 TRINITY_DN2479_c0_g1~~TRINITY_DN2479_c0_g1_i1.p1  ORF type:complete len:110 (-),score=23.45 TRINITY_DN2479_c0_g1_i1:318-608(-)